MIINELLVDVDGHHFARCFEELEDARAEQQTRYPMQEVLFLAISSVLSGYESNHAIADFGELKLGWLRRYYPYSNGIPTHETIGNIIGLIDKKAFEQAFVNWVDMAFAGDKVELLHIDGKRLASSVDKELQDVKPQDGGKSASLIVNVYASDQQVVIAQADVSDSGDEKQGAKHLIEQLHLKDKLLTGDGNFCTKDMLQRIRAKGGHYLMTLKKNHPTLFQLAEQLYGDVRVDKMPFHTDETGHGRQEQRTYHAITVRNFKHPKLKEYLDICKIIRVSRQRSVNRKKQGKDYHTVHYYITSSDKHISELSTIIRKHWSIENNLHWVLDVEFKEDESRKRTGNQAANFSLIRKMALNMINQHKGKKSIKATRMACAISDEKRHHILGFS